MCMAVGSYNMLYIVNTNVFHYSHGCNCHITLSRCVQLHKAGWAHPINIATRQKFFAKISAVCLNDRRLRKI